MGIINKQVQIAEESDDILKLLISIAEDAKAGKPILEIATGSLDEFIKAVEGADDIDDEVTENTQAVIRTVGLRVGDLVGVLLKKKHHADPKPDDSPGDVV